MSITPTAVTPESSDSDSPTPSNDPFSSVPSFACKRISLKPCTNQPLVDALAPLREYRFTVYGTAPKESISYATAVSTIIGCPVKIETVDQARRLPKIGEKISLKVQEFLETGKIQEAIDLQTNEKLRALKELQTVHGIGFTTANSLYEQGFRTIRDLRDRGQYVSQLEHYEDLQEKIPREEVELIAEFVKVQIEKCRPDVSALVEICGGYRRGKDYSNDVDLLITYPHREGYERGLLWELLERLRVKGFIATLHSSQTPASSRTSTSNAPSSRLDTLDRAFLTFRLPLTRSGGRERVKYRRVDLIVVNWDTWGTALQAWTGSTQFNRDLRRWAEKKSWILDAGGLRSRETDKVETTRSEKDLFRILELDWIPPTSRRADP